MASRHREAIVSNAESVARILLTKLEASLNLGLRSVHLTEVEVLRMVRSLLPEGEPIPLPKRERQRESAGPTGRRGGRVGYFAPGTAVVICSTGEQGKVFRAWRGTKGQRYRVDVAKGPGITDVRNVPLEDLRLEPVNG